MKINARMCILNTPPRIKLDLSKLVLALSVIDVYRVRAAQSLSLYLALLVLMLFMVAAHGARGKQNRKRSTIKH